MKLPPDAKRTMLYALAQGYNVAAKEGYSLTAMACAELQRIIEENPYHELILTAREEAE